MFEFDESDHKIICEIPLEDHKMEFHKKKQKLYLSNVEQYLENVLGITKVLAKIISGYCEGRYTYMNVLGTVFSCFYLFGEGEGFSIKYRNGRSLSFLYFRNCKKNGPYTLYTFDENVKYHEYLKE